MAKSESALVPWWDQPLTASLEPTQQGQARVIILASMIEQCHHAQPCGPHFTHFHYHLARGLQSQPWYALPFPGPGKAPALDRTHPSQPLQPFTTPPCLILTKTCGKGRARYTDKETEASNTTSSLSCCLAPSTVTLEARVSLLALNKTLWVPRLHGCGKESGSPPAASHAHSMVTEEVQVIQYCD